MRKNIVVFLCLLVITGLSGCASFPKSYSENVKERKTRIATTNIELGLAYLEYGSHERAKESLEAAIELAPYLPAAWSAMGYYYEFIHEPIKANGYYLHAIQIAPDDAAAHNNYGTFLCRQGHYKASIFEFLQAAENDNYLKQSQAYENASYCAGKIPNKKMQKYYMRKAMAFSDKDVDGETQFQ